jgi:hypothetical protein
MNATIEVTPSAAGTAASVLDARIAQLTRKLETLPKNQTTRRNMIAAEIRDLAPIAGALNAVAQDWVAQIVASLS